MREFIGHRVKFAVEQMGMVEGTVVDEKPSMLLVQGSDGKITRVVKAHICGFLPLDFEPFEYVPFHVLFCENRKMSCPGVQYVKEGEGFSRQDIEVFAGPCPCRNEGCTVGTKGELRSVSGKFMHQMLHGTMFGEYPKKGAVHAAAERRTGTAGAATTPATGKGRSREAEQREEQDNGGEGGAPAAASSSGSEG